MKPMNAAQIMKYLQEHGFIKSHGVGSHRGMFNPQTGKRIVIPFHGKEPLPQGTLLAICRQAGVPKPQR
jgi:predicted RNA binding protein YcfA (HicA-like mRNA interferase family)